MTKKREKKGYQGAKLAGDNDEYRKRRAKQNSQDEKRISNEMFASDDGEFKEACEKAGILPTKRQASKFRNGYGKALAVLGRSTRKVPEVFNASK